MLTQKQKLKICVSSIPWLEAKHMKGFHEFQLHSIIEMWIVHGFESLEDTERTDFAFRNTKNIKFQISGHPKMCKDSPTHSVQ